MSDQQNNDILTLKEEHSTPCFLRDLAFSSNGNALAYPFGTLIKVRELRKNKVRYLIGDQQQILTIVISPDGKKVFSCSRNGEIIRWDIRKKIQHSTVKRLPSFGEYSLAMSTDGQYIAAYNYEQIDVFDTNGNEIKEFKNCQSFPSFCGHTMAYVQKNHFHIWNAQSTKIVKGPKVKIGKPYITANQSYVYAICLENGGIGIWRPPNDSLEEIPFHTFQNNHAQISSIAFHPIKPFLAVTSGDGMMNILHTTSQTIVAQNHISGISFQAMFHPKINLLAVTNNTQMHLFELKNI